MIFELAVRFRPVNLKLLSYAKYSFMALIFILFCIGSALISNALANESYDKDISSRLSVVNSYIFLTLFVMMLALNINLLLQIRKNENECKLIRNAMKREKFVLITVLVFFELGYFMRFIIDLREPVMTERG